MRRLALVLALCTCALGCRTTGAVAPLERPLLDVPPPPPRIVEPPPIAPVPRGEPLADIEPVPDLQPSSPAVTAKPRSSSPRELPSKDIQKPEVKNEVAVAEVIADPAASAPSAPAAPAPLLRTPATADPAAAEQLIRGTLDRASKLLNAVDYARATELRKKAYNEVKDFITEAEAATKASNFELGRELAEKAEKFARELQGR